MAISKIASTDLGYTTGQLSLYPEAKDSKTTLYEASNNATTNLKQSLTYAGKYLIVDDNSMFPNQGLLRIGSPPGQTGPGEIIYYGTKTNGLFKDLIRGFAGSRQNPWPVGSKVSNAVFAEHHNAVKDAILNMQQYLGLKDLPSDDSLNGILKAQERRFLAPRALFRAYPTKGPPSLTVRFQNFSTGPLIRYLWDFGDGTTSAEESPNHTYIKEGVYTVKLNVITSLGAQGITTKTNYITVSEEEKQPFFYTTSLVGTTSTEFNFVDQTDGDIIQRYWIFDGAGEAFDPVTQSWIPVTSESVPVFDPNVHTIKFRYQYPGVYQPSLLILFESQNLKRAYLTESITVN
jgi:PKD repeat protein